jgi:hypothetical protein
MNALFATKRYAEAAHLALSITALSKDELRDTFERHDVQVCTWTTRPSASTG